MIPVPNEFPTAPFCGIVFVGEAPSDEELEKRRPLCGPTGRFYDKLLRMAGIDRASVGTFNVFQDKLPDNEVTNWCKPARFTSQWAKDGLEPYASGRFPPIGKAGYLEPGKFEHLDRLFADLDKLKPNVVVPMGDTALWALTGMTDISLFRGTISRARTGYKIVPTFHPAFLFHSYDKLVFIVKDFEKAARQAESPEVKLPKREVVIPTRVAEIGEFYQDELKGRVIGADIETMPAYKAITCISFAGNNELAMTVPFVNLDKKSRSYWGSPALEVAALKSTIGILRSPEEKLFQNGSYDVQWIFEKWKTIVRNYTRDTRLLHHALYPELEKSLAFLGSNYCDVPPWKTYSASRAEKRDE